MPSLSTGGGAPGIPAASDVAETIAASATAVNQVLIFPMFHSLSNCRLSSSSDSEGHGERADKHHAFHEVLSVIGRVQHGEAVQQDADKDRAHHCAADVGTSRIENRVADQSRRHAVEQHR